MRVTHPFYLGVTEVTRGQFERLSTRRTTKPTRKRIARAVLAGTRRRRIRQDAKFTWLNAGFEQTDEHPVVNVSWNDAVAFIEWLKRKEVQPYRLPTEAEWEYAVPGGNNDTWYFSGDDPETLATVGNVADGTAKAKIPGWDTIAAPDGYVFTAPVGRFQANAFSLYDLHGNVYEWCQDVYDSEYYKSSPTDDPLFCLAGATLRVFRGGSWDTPHFCRSADRLRHAPEHRYNDLGFRLARGKSEPGGH